MAYGKQEAEQYRTREGKRGEVPRAHRLPAHGQTARHEDREHRNRRHGGRRAMGAANEQRDSCHQHQYCVRRLSRGQADETQSRHRRGDHQVITDQTPHQERYGDAGHEQHRPVRCSR